jgi:hypothetical protein
VRTHIVTADTLPADALRARIGIRALRGKAEWSGDLDAMRTDGEASTTKDTKDTKRPVTAKAPADNLRR